MTLVWGTIMHFYSCIMVDFGAREEAELYLLGSRESATAFLIDGRHALLRYCFQRRLKACHLANSPS